MVCIAEGGCLPLTTTEPLSEVSGAADSGCLPRTTALPMSKTVGCGGDDRWTPSVSLASGSCRSEGARLPLSASVLLTRGVSGVDRSRATGCATLARGSVRVACVSAATGAGVGGGGEFAPSHAHKATAQTLTVTATLAARAAFLNPQLRLASRRRVELGAIGRGSDATDAAPIA